MMTVFFHGGLKQFGRRFDLHVASPAEALHALFSQIPDLRRYIAERRFTVKLNGQERQDGEIVGLFRRPAAGELHLVPVAAGAGGFRQAVIGTTLVFAGFMTGQGWLINMGASLALGGVAQMLAKTPKLDGGKGAESSRNSSFSNIGNNHAQGRPVPLAYGLPYCGSAMVSQGVESYRVDRNVAASDPVFQAAELEIEKRFTGGRAAVAPNGRPYNTDFAHESVRARNYVAQLKVKT